LACHALTAAKPIRKFLDSASQMTAKDIVDQAADYAYEALQRVGGDPSKLVIPLQTVVVIYFVQAIIDNGGFRYLFENDLALCPPYSFVSEAYRRIGAIDAADRLDNAVAMFPFENPHRHAKERNDFMDSLDESHPIFALGDQVCGDELIWAALEMYVTKNLAAFQLALT
jgi:uncharacterized protein DUF4375